MKHICKRRLERELWKRLFIERLRSRKLKAWPSRPPRRRHFPGINEQKTLTSFSNFGRKLFITLVITIMEVFKLKLIDELEGGGGFAALGENCGRCFFY